MKNLKNVTNNQSIKTILTVIITLLSVSALIGSFYMGMQYQKSVNDSVSDQVKNLVTVTQLKK
jgi:flagellar basal body-associated protein FliL